MAEIEGLILDSRTEVRPAKQRMVERLRQLETQARRQRSCRQELQLIMSARRLLGDAENFGIVHGAFGPDARRA
ncbi:hypothetical protein [Methylobacterium sp. JK268]